MMGTHTGEKPYQCAKSGFRFELKPGDTPQSFAMEDADEIHAMVEVLSYHLHLHMQSLH